LFDFGSSSYTKKTQLEHILLRPDTYIGSVEKHTQPMWVLDQESKKITLRPCSYVPGLYKIFDEILVNAADNKQRDPSMNKIDVVIDREDGFISVLNNGKSIPVVVHKEHNVYIPELVFGHLLTGSNFDDKEEKTTGGRNGYGAKLANIFSTKFIVEVGDSTNGVNYKQEFQNNMAVINAPKLTKYSGKDFTKVTFYPDFAKFKMPEGFQDSDIYDLLSKRVYDIAGTNIAGGPKLTVSLNNEKIDLKKFEDYVSIYNSMELPLAFEKVNERWEIGIGPSDGSFQQISYVNSICTSKGGSHVAYVVDQITTKLVASIKKKTKDEIKPNQIKNHLAVYINCLITNPSFDSQTKENLTTKASNFGSACVLPEKMLKVIEKSSIIDNILNWAKYKQTAELKKKSGSKRSKVIGITKLDDANYAGTSKSSQCTLILTEGDSAKALAISGLGVVGRDYYGVFPLKGKLLNVREASHPQIMKNEEIQNISKILGLTFGKVYSETSSLRYGHLMIMTDQDHDGSHIKGLLINFIHYFWPSLLQIPGFLQQFITPIVKCSKGKEEIPFYTIPQYQTWKDSNNDGKGWKIKYYKGLGTSTSQEAKEYFSDLGTHRIDFSWDDNADDMIDMAFAKKRVDDRKLWLLAMEPGIHIDYTEEITYNKFINHELILFSHADNERSIAHYMDGLKPSQRKVLFACFKRNLKNEIKVAQLAGYVSEHSAYHHGEASLTQTIVGMAQNFVGSNNINLLSPCGQFGTRLMGGKDAASPRYIFTKLEEITRLIFHQDDDCLLEYLDEDGQSIEPTFYVPVIPMALVNGSEGIGTGWSSTIPNYNPMEIIANLKKMITGEEPEEMNPWFHGFSGAIYGKEGKNTTNFHVAGAIEQIDEQTVQITELPVGKWTTDYKQFLESVLIGNTAPKEKDADGKEATNTPFVKDFKENHTDTTVLFTVTVPAEKLVEINNEKGGLMKKFKLEGSVSTTNMNLFDLNGQIRKYESPVNVMKDFFQVRLQLYVRRRSVLCNKLDKDWRMLDNKMRFVTEIIQGKLVVSNRKKQELLLELQQKGYETFYPESSTSAAANEENALEEETPTNSKSLDKGYDYLLGLKLWNLTMEKVKELTEQRDTKAKELEILKNKTAEMIWLEDLEKLELGIQDLYEKQENENKPSKSSKKAAGIKKSSTTAHIPKPKPVVAKPPVAAKSASVDLKSSSTDSLISTVVAKTEKLTLASSKASKANKEPVIDLIARSTSSDGMGSKSSDRFLEAFARAESPTLAINRPARAATKKPVTYIADSDEDEEDALEDSEDEECASFNSSVEFDEDKDDDEDDDAEAKKKTATKAPPAAKKVPVTVAVSKPAPVAAAKPKAAPVPAAKKAPAPKKKSKKSFDSDDEESEMDFDEDEEDEDSFDMGDSDEEVSFDEKPKKKKAAAAPAKPKSAPVPKEPKKTAVATKEKAVKEPKATKKAPAIVAAPITNYFPPSIAAVSKPAATTKPVAEKKKRSQSSKKDNDDSDAILLSPPIAAAKKAKREAKMKEIEEEEEEVAIVARPARQRKVTNFAKYYDEEEEEEEADQGSDVSDSFIANDDDSDFE
jgi:DNA topoisomerase-2